MSTAFTKKWVPSKLSCVLALLFLFFISMMRFSLPGEVKAFGNGFLYSRSITIESDLVPSTQTDFPVLISGTYDGTGGTADLRTVGNGGKVENASGYDVGFYTNSDCSTGKM